VTANSVWIAGGDFAIQAAKNFRTLRSRGITIRKTIDTLIATSCIEKGLALLYSDDRNAGGWYSNEIMRFEE
jgi:predicted nucleic acid-binding protein